MIPRALASAARSEIHLVIYGSSFFGSPPKPMSVVMPLFKMTSQNMNVSSIIYYDCFIMLSLNLGNRSSYDYYDFFETPLKIQRKEISLFYFLIVVRVDVSRLFQSAVFLISKLVSYKNLFSSYLILFVFLLSFVFLIMSSLLS